MILILMMIIIKITTIANLGYREEIEKRALKGSLQD